MNLSITKLDDPAILLAVNNAAVPDVSPVDASKAEWMVAHCVVPGLAMLNGQVAGVVADVCSRPPNIPSLSLHHAMGYEEVGTQSFPAIDKTASKLMKYIEHGKATTRL